MSVQRQKSLTKFSEKHSFDKNKVSIAVDPNSYFPSGVTPPIDTRQLLYSISGVKLPPNKAEHSQTILIIFMKMYF